MEGDTLCHPCHNGHLRREDRRLEETFLVNRSRFVSLATDPSIQPHSSDACGLGEQDA